ncbi:MAG: hypothetical protein JSS61_07660 [Verrucomicrobia bacterium]|nr:hypothetical protein [Verrucomicrobiota bacterium]
MNKLILSGALLSADPTVDAAELDITTFSEQNELGKWQGKTTSASADKGFTIDGAFLYWQAHEDGLEYAQKINVFATPPASPIVKVNTDKNNLHFEWNPGVRVSLGYISSGMEQWDLNLAWTYMYSKAHGSASTSGDLGLHNLRPVWAPLLMGFVADSASAKWHMHFNTLDLTLGRNYFAGKTLAVKPTIGVRGAWIDQHYTAKYHGAHTDGASTFFHDNSFKAHNDFTGGGIRIGGDFTWYMSRNWNVVGNLFGSLIYGRFNVKQIEDGEILVSGFLIPEHVNMKDHFNRVRPNVEGKLGLQWQSFFNKEKYRFSIGAFYDLSYWFEQNELFNTISYIDPTTGENPIVPTRNPGDLSFQGVSGEIRFEF